MSRLCAVVWVAAAIAVNPVSAEPPPHMDFVRCLRADGMPDLAMEYLQKLQANPPADVADLIPLELARTILDQTSSEFDEGKRTAMLAQARGEFEKYLKKNANHAEANIEMARLTSLMARQQLTRALRSESEAAIASEAAKARPLFDEAANKYLKAAKLLDDEIKKLKGEGNGPAIQTRLKGLVDAQARARLDENINFFNLSETYIGKDPAILLAKSVPIKKARKGFGVIYENSETVDRYGWQALAWYANLSVALGEPLVAAKKYDELFKVRLDPVASDGIRMARYFKIWHAYRGEDDGSKVASGSAQSIASPLAQAWLKDYGAYRNTPEGLGAKYVYASCQVALAEAGITRDPKTGKVKSISSVPYLQTAEKAYKELSEFDNEYVDKARRRRMNILIDLADAEEKGIEPVPSAVASFDRAVLQAQIQEARLIQFLRKQEDPDSPEGKAKSVEQQKLRIGKSIAFLERGLQIATPRDLPRDVFESKLLLAQCYLNGGQAMTAAVFAEDLARSNTRQPKAAAACALAVQGYNRMAGEALAQGDNGKAIADVDIGQLRRLAQYMDVTWPTESATDDARLLWGIYTARDKNYANAIAIFSRIHPSYANVNQARLQQGGALFSLIRTDVESSRLADVVPDLIKKYQKEWTSTLASLRNLPEPSSAAPYSEMQNYVLARLQLCQLLLLEGKQYREVESVAAAAAETLAEATSFKESERDELSYSVKSMRLSGIQGQTALLLQEGAFAKVAALTKAPLDAIKKEIDEAADPKNKEKIAGLQKLPTYERYARGQRDILIIALRTSIQDNRIDDAVGLLNTLEKAGGTTENRIANLRSLVGTVRNQFETLHKSGKAVEEKKLVEGFTKFLDQIAVQPNPPTALTLFLSQGYAGIDQNARSVEILEKLLKSLPVPAGTDNADAANRTYRQTQFSLAKAYRQAKMYDRAKEYLDKQLIGTVKEKGPFYSSVEARKERAFLFEDQGEYRSAVAYWTSIAKMFGEPLPPPNPDKDTDARKRAVYFDLFYESQRCSADAFNSLDPKKYATQKADGFDKIATRLHDMETKNGDLSNSLKDKVRELIEKYPPIKTKYRALGGKLLDTN